jgi:hypothetical protein
VLRFCFDATRDFFTLESLQNPPSGFRRRNAARKQKDGDAAQRHRRPFSTPLLQRQNRLNTDLRYWPFFIVPPVPPVPFVLFVPPVPLLMPLLDRLVVALFGDAPVPVPMPPPVPVTPGEP